MKVSSLPVQFLLGIGRERPQWLCELGPAEIRRAENGGLSDEGITICFAVDVEGLLIEAAFDRVDGQEMENLATIRARLRLACAFEDGVPWPIAYFGAQLLLELFSASREIRSPGS